MTTTAVVESLSYKLTAATSTSILDDHRATTSRATTPDIIN